MNFVQMPRSESAFLSIADPRCATQRGRLLGARYLRRRDPAPFDCSRHAAALTCQGGCVGLERTEEVFGVLVESADPSIPCGDAARAGGGGPSAEADRD